MAFKQCQSADCKVIESSSTSPTCPTLRLHAHLPLSAYTRLFGSYSFSSCHASTSTPSSSLHSLLGLLVFPYSTLLIASNFPLRKEHGCPTPFIFTSTFFMAPVVSGESVVFSLGGEWEIRYPGTNESDYTYIPLFGFHFVDVLLFLCFLRAFFWFFWSFKVCVGIVMAVCTMVGRIGGDSKLVLYYCRYRGSYVRIRCLGC